MKSIRVNRLRMCAGLVAATAFLLSADRAQAAPESEEESQEAAEAQPEAKPQAQPQPGPKAQAQPLPPPPMPYGYQPYTNWRPLEAPKAAEKDNVSSFAWDPLRFGVGGEIRTLYPQNSATRRLVGKSDPDGGGVTVSGDVLRLTPKVRVVVDLGWGAMSSTNANSSSSDEQKLRSDLITAGLSLRAFVFRWMAPYARVAGGVGWDKVSVEGSSGKWQDKHVFAHGSAGAGLYLRTPGLRMATAYPSFSMAFMGSIEGGYFLAPSSNVALEASSDPAIKNPIPSDAVSLGTMGRSAPYLRVTLGLAF